MKKRCGYIRDRRSLYARSRTVTLATQIIPAAWLCMAMSSEAQAQSSYPAACAPIGTAQCTGYIVTPWIYRAKSCGAPPFQQSEEAALADYPGLDGCNAQTTRLGWFTETTNVYDDNWSADCPGEGSWLPGYNRNIEVLNYSRYIHIAGTVVGGACTNVREHRKLPVYRTRDIICPRGYTGSPNGYCYIQNTTRDPTKNFGEQCPTCGNPINPANGNKFQRELDYQLRSGSLLRFERFYNSQLRRSDNENTYHYSSSYTSRFGNGAHATLAVVDPEVGDYWRNLAPDAIGANWRHNFQRSIALSNAGQDGAVSSAFAFRPDGRVFAFNLYNGEYHPPQDVNDRLVRVVDANGQTTGWTYRTGNGLVVETYDATGRLIAIAGERGESLTLSYDAIGRLASVTDAFGHSLTFEYDEASTDEYRTVRIRRIITPGGEVYSYGFGAVGTLESVTYPDGKSKTYLYENSSYPRALTGIIDENGIRIRSWSYDSHGRAYESKLAGDVDRVTLTFDTGGVYGPQDEVDRAWITDSRGVTRRWDYGTVIQGVAKITAMAQPAASGSGTVTSTFAYDSHGNVISKTDFKGNRTCYAYNKARNLEIARLEGVAPGIGCPSNLLIYTPAYGTRERKITTQWHPTYRLPTQIDSGDRRTSFTYDAAGNLVTKTILDLATNASRTWTYTYDGVGRVLTVDGPRTDVNDVTTYTYYDCDTGFQCGQVETVRNALGHVTRYNAYNAHGLPVTIADPNGVVTSLSYDSRQRLVSRTVGGESTTFEYWPDGKLKKVTSPDGTYLEYMYDDARRLTSIRDSEGNRIAYTLDSTGNRTAEEVFDPSNALSRARTRIFDALNRLQQEISTAGGPTATTYFEYDDNGNQIGIDAPLGRSTGQGYDELDRLVRVVDANGGEMKYRYDALDQLIEVTDPRGQTTSYTYNALGDLLEEASPVTGTTFHQYDSAGNVTSRTDARGKTASYTYDALNRPVQVAYSDQTLTYSYDQGPNGIGRLSNITDGSGSTAWSYDAHGRVLSRQQTMGSVVTTVGYSYDAAGRLENMTYPSGNVVTYSYADGKISSLTLNGTTTILSQVLYQPFGPTRGWTWGNMTLAVREHDADGKVVAVDSAGAKTYAYDDAQRITMISDLDDPDLSQTYGYDAVDRLTSATGTSINQGWTYDANGNRLSQTGIPIPNITPATFAYDDRGRMVSATTSAGATTYSLNALGQRVRKTTAGASTYFVYDETGHLIGEYDNSGDPIQETIWFGDIPVATLQAGNLFYIHTDHLNTPRRITRPSDNVVVWRWDSDPFGTAAADEDPDGDSTPFVYNLRFPGQYYDEETGLHYNYFRDYDPSTGRYVQSDPIGLDGGLNTYSYAEHDPISYIDPFGLQAVVPWVLPRPIVVPRPTVVPRPYPVDPVLPIPIPGDRSEADREECERACDAQWDRDMFWCETMWKMKGRPKGGYTECKREANRKYIKCYQNCGPMC